MDSPKSDKKNEELRKKRNQELIKRMREGDALRTVDSFSSWFPPRPIVKKDAEALAKLYPKAKTEPENVTRLPATPQDDASSPDQVKS